MKKDFLSFDAWSSKEITGLLDLADLFKKNPIGQDLLHQNWGLIFNKESTRTRVSFEVGIHQLGAQSLFLQPNALQLGRGETIADTARVLERYLDGVVIRTYSHEEVEIFAQEARLCVINGLTDLEHPCQILADFMTIREKLGSLENKRICYLGDGNNNMTRSMIAGAAKMGVFITIAAPNSLWPEKDFITQQIKKSCHGAKFINLTDNAIEAVQNADILYTDVWLSMGQKDETGEKLKLLKPFQINEKLFKHAPKHALFMHCLPAHREEEVTDYVLDHERSIVFDQAENRLHAQKAILKTVSKARKNER